MNEHTWVKQVFIPVSKAELVDGAVLITIDPELQDTCVKGNAAYGCVACEVPLTPQTIHTSCTNVMPDPESHPQRTP